MSSPAAPQEASANPVADQAGTTVGQLQLLYEMLPGTELAIISHTLQKDGPFLTIAEVGERFSAKSVEDLDFLRTKIREAVTRGGVKKELVPSDAFEPVLQITGPVTDSIVEPITIDLPKIMDESLASQPQATPTESATKEIPAGMLRAETQRTIARDILIRDPYAKAGTINLAILAKHPTWATKSIQGPDLRRVRRDLGICYNGGQMESIDLSIFNRARAEAGYAAWPDAITNKPRIAMDEPTSVTRKPVTTMTKKPATADELYEIIFACKRKDFGSVREIVDLFGWRSFHQNSRTPTNEFNRVTRWIDKLVESGKAKKIDNHGNRTRVVFLDVGPQKQTVRPTKNPRNARELYELIVTRGKKEFESIKEVVSVFGWKSFHRDQHGFTGPTSKYNQVTKWIDELKILGKARKISKPGLKTKVVFLDKNPEKTGWTDDGKVHLIGETVIARMRRMDPTEALVLIVDIVKKRGPFETVADLARTVGVDKKDVRETAEYHWLVRKVNGLYETGHLGKRPIHVIVDEPETDPAPEPKPPTAEPAKPAKGLFGLTEETALRVLDVHKNRSQVLAVIGKTTTLTETLEEIVKPGLRETEEKIKRVLKKIEEGLEP